MKKIKKNSFNLSVEDAGIIASKIAEIQKLDAREEAFFIAGFQECVKYINNKNENI